MVLVQCIQQRRPAFQRQLDSVSVVECDSAILMFVVYLRRASVCASSWLCISPLLSLDPCVVFWTSERLLIAAGRRKSPSWSFKGPHFEPQLARRSKSVTRAECFSINISNETIAKRVKSREVESVAFEDAPSDSMYLESPLIDPKKT